MGNLLNLIAKTRSNEDKKTTEPQIVKQSSGFMGFTTDKKPHDSLVNIILIGPIRSGKTLLFKSITGKLTNNKDCSASVGDTYVSTVGVDFATVNFGDGKAITKMRIWDTSGHRQFRTISTDYYKCAQVIVIVSNFEKSERAKKTLKEMQHNIETHADSNAICIDLINKTGESIQNLPVTEIERHPKTSYMMDIGNPDNVKKFFVHLLKDYQRLSKSI